VDAHGRPALLLRRTGAGSVVLCTYPIEHMAAATPRVTPEVTSVLYDALAVHAGVTRLVTVEDPRCHRHPGPSGRHAFRLAGEPGRGAIAVKPQLAAGLRLSALDGDTANGEVSLAGA
jgi:hypothetical protein